MTEHLKIIVAEDDYEVAQTLTDTLNRWGAKVMHAEDGEAAQALLQAHPDIDLLLTDFRMPKIDGAQLLGWCRERGLHFPVVLLSATFGLLQKEKCALCDCCAFLLYKPFGLQQLQDVVSTALERHHARICPPNIS